MKKSKKKTWNKKIKGDWSFLKEPMKKSNVKVEWEKELEKLFDSGLYSININKTYLTIKEETKELIRKTLQEDKKLLLAEIKRKIQKKVYAYDEKENSGAVDFKDILQILKEYGKTTTRN